MWGLVLITVFLVVVLSPFASKSPDGLNRVAKDYGFQRLQSQANFPSFFSGYQILPSLVGAAIIATVIYLALQLRSQKKNSPGQRKYRVAGVLLFITTTTMISNWQWLVGVALATFLFVLWQAVPLQDIVKRLLLLVPFGLGTAVLMPLQFTDKVAGIEAASVVIVKMVVAGMLLTYLLRMYSPVQLFESFRDLGMPAMLVEIINMMWRYFHLLVDEFRSMIKAQRARGMEWRGVLWSKAMYVRFGELLGGLFVRALSRSNRVYLAMASRGSWKIAEHKSHEVEIRKGVSRMALRLSNVNYFYGDYQVLHDINLTIPRGSKVALMGHNGAGKSTLIALLNGLETPNSGELLFFGEPVTESKLKHIRRQVGVVYQDPDDQIFSPSVWEDVAFGPRNMGLTESEVQSRVETALGSVGMRALKDRSPFELSYGQKRRVAIAGVLAMQPEVIIMDEPMAFLDPSGRDELQALLESLHFMGMTLVIATHDVDFAAEWADQIVVIKEGRVFAEGTADILFDEKLTRQAGLHLPRLARPFRLLSGVEQPSPRTIREAAQAIWKLMVRSNESQLQEQEQKKNYS
jgi:cobalt transport protein ATP-binding subunit